jgi:hypothetical protein
MIFIWRNTDLLSGLDLVLGILYSKRDTALFP